MRSLALALLEKTSMRKACESKTCGRYSYCSFCSHVKDWRGGNDIRRRPGRASSRPGTLRPSWSSSQKRERHMRNGRLHYNIRGAFPKREEGALLLQYYTEHNFADFLDCPIFLTVMRIDFLSGDCMYYSFTDGFACRIRMTQKLFSSSF